jgi:hypothetical protein
MSLENVIDSIVENNPSINWGKSENSVSFILDTKHDPSVFKFHIQHTPVNLDKVNLSIEFLFHFGGYNGETISPSIWRHVSWKYLIPEIVYGKFIKHLDADGISFMQPINDYLIKNYPRMLRERAMKLRSQEGTLSIPNAGLKKFYDETHDCRDNP